MGGEIEELRAPAFATHRLEDKNVHSPITVRHDGCWKLVRDVKKPLIQVGAAMADGFVTVTSGGLAIRARVARGSLFATIPPKISRGFFET